MSPTHPSNTSSSTAAASPRSASQAGRRRRTVWIVLGVAVAGAVAAAAGLFLFGHGTSGDTPATFVTRPGFKPGAEVSCLEHQTDLPNAAYQGGSSAQAVPELTFLAYYTAAGRKPFCDGGSASDEDKAWAQLYVQLTTNAENVSTILGGR